MEIKPGNIYTYTLFHYVAKNKGEVESMWDAVTQVLSTQSYPDRSYYRVHLNCVNLLNTIQEHSAS